MKRCEMKVWMNTQVTRKLLTKVQNAKNYDQANSTYSIQNYGDGGTKLEIICMPHKYLVNIMKTGQVQFRVYRADFVGKGSILYNQLLLNAADEYDEVVLRNVLSTILTTFDTYTQYW